MDSTAIAYQAPHAASPLRHPLDHLTPQKLFGSLPLLRCRLALLVDNGRHLPDFLGSAIRGVLGWELQRLVCPFPKRPACATCIIGNHCPYCILIEGKADLPGFSDSPRGYILHAEKKANDPGKIALEMTLVGDCISFFPAVVEALVRGGERGLGSNRFRYRVDTLCTVRPDGAAHNLPLMQDRLAAMARPAPLSDWLHPPFAGEVTLRLTMPLRLRRKGKYLGEFDGPFFLETVGRRLEALHVLFNKGEPLPGETWEALRQLFDGFRPEASRLRWHDLERYSNRQKNKVPLGGLTGTIRATISPEIGAWLQAAALVHVGKAAAMGLGRVETERGTEEGTAAGERIEHLRTRNVIRRRKI